jgi:hypothetical protein
VQQCSSSVQQAEAMEQLLRQVSYFKSSLTLNPQQNRAVYNRRGKQRNRLQGLYWLLLE